MKQILTTPLGWFLVAGVLALVLAIRVRRQARTRSSLALALVVALAVALVLGSASPLVAETLAAPLDRRGLAWPPAPPWAGREDPDAIVVLAAGLEGSAVPGAPLGAASLERVHAALAASRRWPSAVVLFSGGSPTGDPVTAGQRMAQEAVRVGLAPERVVIESRSTDTHDNAVFSARILERMRLRRVALVTSADHMARSRAAFLAAGVATSPEPSGPPLRVDHGVRSLVPDADALARTTSVAHELIGLVVYRVRGWI